MNVSEHVTALILERLQERGMLVWYDPDGHFRELFAALDHASLVKVDASASVLAARRQADRAWRTLLDVEGNGVGPVPVLVYAPYARGAEDDEQGRRADLFEPFAVCGAAFGDRPVERLASLARAALGWRDAEVDRIFAEGRPSLAELDKLAAGARYPQLEQALGTEVPGRVAAVLLCRPADVAAALADAPGLLAELRRLLADAYGFDPQGASPPEALGPLLARWLLFSELAFDGAGALPEALAHQPRAGERYRRAIFELCGELRSSARQVDAYRQHAIEVEKALGLSPLGASPAVLGARDTFAFQEQSALLGLQQRMLDGDTASARALLEAKRASVWRALPERDQLWRLAERCLDLLTAGATWSACRARCGGLQHAPVRDHVLAYTAAEGLWRVDQAQRLMEQAAAVLVDRNSLMPALEHCRKAYRQWLDEAQAGFLAAVAADGWPADGVVRHNQAWSRHAAGAVRDGRRVAWFLVDALRFEMGRELAERLRAEGQVVVEPVCGTVPAATPFGMAALLPGAETGLGYGERDGALVPLIAGRPVPSAEDRRRVFRAELGDRFRSLRLGDLLTAPSAQLKHLIGGADALGVFSTEIDDLGEHGDPLQARRYIGEVVADLLAAANRLIDLGFQRLVFASDHGFMQLPEVLPGDRCQEPPGQWLLRTRRALLGAVGAVPDSVLVLDAARLGIQGPVREVCVPRGCKVFRAGSPYFHEGLSLQESVLPFVVLDAAQRRSAGDMAARVSLYYRSDCFRSRIFSLRIGYASLLEPEKQVRVRAYMPGSTRVVGEAADCEARDPHTGLVTLQASVDVHVPIALTPDFAGDKLEVRALDAMPPGVVLARLTLHYAVLEQR